MSTWMTEQWRFDIWRGHWCGREGCGCVVRVLSCSVWSEEMEPVWVGLWGSEERVLNRCVGQIVRLRFFCRFDVGMRQLRNCWRRSGVAVSEDRLDKARRDASDEGDCHRVPRLRVSGPDWDCRRELVFGWVPLEVEAVLRGKLADACR